MVQCEAQLGNTGNSVRLILVLGSSTKLKSVTQLWVARQSSSSTWPVFHLPEPWQRESMEGGGSSFLCVWSRAVLMEQSCMSVHPCRAYHVGRQTLAKRSLRFDKCVHLWFFEAAS